VSLRQLCSLVWTTIAQALTHPKIALQDANEIYDSWDERRRQAEELQRGLERANDERERRRRFLSWQHENEGITDAEYLARLSQLRREEEDQPVIAPFLEPEPPSPHETRINTDFVNKVLSRYEAHIQHVCEVLANPQDKLADKMAEKLGVKVIVLPPAKVGLRYSVSILFNWPLWEECTWHVGDRDNSWPLDYDRIGSMVFESS
jgi:hypothetical protein